MLLQAHKGGLPRHPRAEALRRVIMPFVEEAWRRPDEVTWEVRWPTACMGRRECSSRAASG
jgi:hypothetical protein